MDPSSPSAIQYESKEYLLCTDPVRQPAETFTQTPSSPVCRLPWAMPPTVSK